jgi:hypothetical protein
MSPEMEAAYDGYGFVEWGALKIEFPDRTVRLLDRAGYLDLGSGEVFTGEDEVYGEWAAADDIPDGVDGEAPRFQFSLAVPDAATAQAMVLPGSAYQMSPVTVLTGLVDPMTGGALPGWETEFVGYFDVARRHTARGEGNLVECDSFSVFEHLMENAEGVRLNGAWHKERYPDELGLDHIVDVEKVLPWGTGGANSGFSGSGKKDGPWWTDGFTPGQKWATRALGGYGYLTNPFIMTGQNLKQTRRLING